MLTFVSRFDGIGFDAFGDVLQPQLMAAKMGQTVQMAPQITPNTTTTANANQSLFKGDLDSSLASLAQNLDINGPKGSFKKCVHTANPYCLSRY
jgi:hypothetical protein